MTRDAAFAWQRLTRHLFLDSWPGFVVEQAALVLLCADDEVATTDLDDQINRIASDWGWRARHDGEVIMPREQDASWALSPTLQVWTVCELVESAGEWPNERLRLTEVGTAAALTRLRHSATGPSDLPA